MSIFYRWTSSFLQLTDSNMCISWVCIFPQKRVLKWQNMFYAEGLCGKYTVTCIPTQRLGKHISSVTKLTIQLRLLVFRYAQCKFNWLKADKHDNGSLAENEIILLLKEVISIRFDQNLQGENTEDKRKSEVKSLVYECVIVRGCEVLWLQ